MSQGSGPYPGPRGQARAGDTMGLKDHWAEAGSVGATLRNPCVPSSEASRDSGCCRNFLREVLSKGRSGTVAGMIPLRLSADELCNHTGPAETTLCLQAAVCFADKSLVLSESRTHI